VDVIRSAARVDNPLPQGLRDARCILIWRWADSPKEFRALSPFGGETEESVVYVPAGLIDADGDYDTKTRGLWFLGEPHPPGISVEYGGDRWGWYSTTELSDGARVTITSESVGFGT
jgi:hypothetical protein